MEGFVQFDQIVAIVVIEYDYAFIMGGSESSTGYMDSMESSVAMPT